MTRLKIVAFAGPKYSGKDTAAKGLFKLNEERAVNLFRHRQMAAPAKAIASMVFGYPAEWNEDPILKEQPLDWWPNKCPRQLVIDVANWYRDQYGGEVWARKFERDALHDPELWGAQVMTDLRFPEELEMIQRHQGLIIYVSRKEAEEALAAKQNAGDEMALNVSESHYDMIKKVANVVVDNDGPIHHLHNTVVSIVRNAWGHWKYWEDIDKLSHAYQKARLAERIA